MCRCQAQNAIDNILNLLFICRMPADSLQEIAQDVYDEKANLCFSSLLE